MNWIAPTPTLFKNPQGTRTLPNFESHKFQQLVLRQTYFEVYTQMLNFEISYKIINKMCLMYTNCTRVLSYALVGLDLGVAGNDTLMLSTPIIGINFLHHDGFKKLLQPTSPCGLVIITKSVGDWRQTNMFLVCAIK